MLTLPAGSVAVAVRLWLPSVRAAVVGVKVQLPEASAVVVPSSVVPSKMLMVLLASAVPASVGVASLVLPPEVSAPVTGATSSVTLATTGVAGAAVSTVRANAELAVLTLPAVSVAVAVRLWLPSVRAVVGVKVQLPEASAVVVPSSVVPSKTLMVLLAFCGAGQRGRGIVGAAAQP